MKKLGWDGDPGDLFCHRFLHRWLISQYLFGVICNWLQIVEVLKCFPCYGLILLMAVTGFFKYYPILAKPTFFNGCGCQVWFSAEGLRDAWGSGTAGQPHLWVQPNSHWGFMSPVECPISVLFGPACHQGPVSQGDLQFLLRSELRGSWWMCSFSCLGRKTSVDPWLLSRYYYFFYKRYF